MFMISGTDFKGRCRLFSYISPENITNKTYVEFFYILYLWVLLSFDIVSKQPRH